MKNIKALTAVLLVSGLALVGCQRAEAQALPVDVSLYYTDNGVIDKEGATVKLGTEYKNLAVGVSAFTTTDKLESYGVYAGVPIRVSGSRVIITPTVAVDQYREESETVGSVGVGLGYIINDTLALSGTALTSRSFGGDSDNFRGETYSVGLVKRF